jgi:Flp pilus assembly protein TadG
MPLYYFFERDLKLGKVRVMIALLKFILSFIGRKFQQLCTNQMGNVAMMFGLAVIPLILAAGTAIDYSRIANAKSNLIAGLDASALYAAAITGQTQAQMKALAQGYLDKNYANTGDAPLTAFELQNFADRVEVNGTVNVRTWFMSVAGITDVDVNASSQIMKAGNSIEVSLVLDVTGSMAGTKIANLKDSANSFVDTVVADNQWPYYSKVAVVPFSIGVNLSSYADAARGTLTPGTCISPGCAIYRFNYGGSQKNYVGTNCGTERIGPAAYTDGSAASNPIGRLYLSAAAACDGISPLIPLTSDRTVLHNTINSLVATGSTAGQVGMAWGWYTISPNFGVWSGASIPAAYPAVGVKLKKIAIFMTDGDFNDAYCNGVVGLDYGAPGVCNATNGDPTVQAQTLCNSMKAQNITVYTIGFQLPTLAAKNFMANCATDSTTTFDAANGADLQAAFDSIAQNLLELRVSR